MNLSAFFRQSPPEPVDQSDLAMPELTELLALLEAMHRSVPLTPRVLKLAAAVSAAHDIGDTATWAAWGEQSAHQTKHLRLAAALRRYLREGVG